MPPEMGKYLKPSRIPYEESSCYSKINFSCPDNIQDIDDACRCVTVVLSPGDVLIVPHKWWHYVENLTTAVSINTWIQIPKYDNMARLSESVVRFLVSSICSGVSTDIQSRLLNPNEAFSSSMTAESINFIDQSIKIIKTEEDTDTTDSEEPDSTSLIKYQYKTYEPDQCLSKVEFDTKYHRHNHTISSLKPNLNTDISYRLLDSLCNDTVINQIVNSLIKED
uniref:HSPB1-associated protein 1 n=1 Tax=Schizaphis graminum TaxID=13262 RepID=A0A2S2NH44_SCHGA